VLLGQMRVARSCAEEVGLRTPAERRLSDPLRRRVSVQRHGRSRCPDPFAAGLEMRPGNPTHRRVEVIRWIGGGPSASRAAAAWLARVRRLVRRPHCGRARACARSRCGSRGRKSAPTAASAMSARVSRSRAPVDTAAVDRPTRALPLRHETAVGKNFYVELGRRRFHRDAARKQR
jgi:hypothetical protein